MPIISYYIQKHWEALDEWLFGQFDFGLLEFAEVLLMGVTQ